MRIAKVIGTVTLNRAHPSLASARLKLVQPLSLDELTTAAKKPAAKKPAAKKPAAKKPAGDSLVAWDEWGAGIGNLIAVSEGREASQPFYPEEKPVDAYNAAILDHVEIPPAATKAKKK